MKNYISRRNFLKAAGAMTGAAAALGLTAAPLSADGLFYPLVAPDKHPITILYTNDVHTYIDNEAPELTYANIAALKKSYEDADMDVLLVDAGDHIQGTAYGAMDDGAAQYIASHLDQDFFDPLIVEDCGEADEELLYKPRAFETPPPAKPQEGIGFWGVVGAVIVALLILSFL